MSGWMIVLVVGHVLSGFLAVGYYRADAINHIVGSMSVNERDLINFFSFMIVIIGYISLLVMIFSYYFDRDEGDRWSWNKPVFRLPK